MPGGNDCDAGSCIPHCSISYPSCRRLFRPRTQGNAAHLHRFYLRNSYLIFLQSSYAHGLLSIGEIRFLLFLIKIISLFYVFKKQKKFDENTRKSKKHKKKQKSHPEASERHLFSSGIASFATNQIKSKSWNTSNTSTGSSSRDTSEQYEPMSTTEAR